jgi:starch synthase
MKKKSQGRRKPKEEKKEEQVMDRVRVILAASEVTPYAKTGGLADVISALPKALARLGIDIHLVAPRYRSVTQGELVFNDLRVPIAWSDRLVSVYRDRNGEVPVYFIDAPEYFNRDGIYGSATGEYRDNAERYAFFSRSVLELAKRLGPPPDVIHCNDWQTGLLPLYLHTVYAGDPYFARTATLFTIHNLAYQGLFDPGLLGRFGIGSDVYRTDDGIEFYGIASALKAGIISATAISTVSPRYAQEIQTSEHGARMDGLLRWRSSDLIGIFNGVDYEVWNPQTDPLIAQHYGPDNLEGKTACKAELLKQFNLPVELERPVVACISRLTAQKGFDLVQQAIAQIMSLDIYFVLLGSGDSGLENFFQRLRDAVPDRVAVYFGFNDTLAHQIEAGADMFLMPSYYEPCGLNQIYSLKYGTPPVVRATGGLDDTVEQYDPATRTGNGFKFYEYNAARMLEALSEARQLYADRQLWQALMLNGMRADYSWDQSARQYVEVYRRLRAVKATAHKAE